MDVAYNLKVTGNKRFCIYEDGLFVATRPFYYSEIEVGQGAPSLSVNLNKEETSPTLLIAPPLPLCQIAAPSLDPELGSKDFILVNPVIYLPAPAPAQSSLFLPSPPTSIVRSSSKGCPRRGNTYIYV